MNRKSKWIWSGILFLAAAGALLVFLWREPILIRAGHFMAPQIDYSADAVILEGSDYISTGFIQAGMDLLSSGKAKKMIVVIHRIAPAHRPFGIGGDYPDIVSQKLKSMGLKERDFRVIVSPIRQPVTLKEAQFVLPELAREQIRTAILLAPAFHTRRSYLCYQFVGEPLRIKIFPRAVFTNYRMEKWWKEEAGIRDFGLELQKLVFYLAVRYIPLKFSY